MDDEREGTSIECPGCRVKLVEPQTRDLYQTDIPPIEPVVTKFVVHGGTCPCCGKYRQGRHEEQITDPTPVVTNVLGPRVLGMAADWKHRLGIVYRKISELFDTCFSLKVSAGALSRAEVRFAQRALPTYEWLIEALRKAGVVHADETGWRVSRRNAWLWVFASKDITIYAIRFSRGSEVPADMLGEDFDDWLSRADGRHADVIRLAKHLRKHRHEWLLFLYDPDIPATNNHGERQIRPGVILRKLGSCHREILHAVAHEITASLTTTCRQRGHPFLTLAKQLWLSRTPRAIPIPA